MMARLPAIGIDLGAAYSCVAVYQRGEVVVLPNDHGNKTTPSCVAFTQFERLVGDSAKSQLTRNPTNTIYDMKCLLGHTVNLSKKWPFAVRGHPKVEVNYKGDSKTFFAEQISSMVLAKMKETAESYLGGSVTDAVVTVPACFNYLQRRATIDACTMAGLNVLSLLNEPSAVALAYALKNQIGVARNVLVFNMGSRTLNVTIFTIEDGIVETKATAGNIQLGGEDFDDQMVEFLKEEFKMKFGKDLSGDKKAVSRLRSACETVKRELSFSVKASIQLDSLHQGTDFNTEVSREKFEDLNAHFFRAILDTVEKAIQYTMVCHNIDKNGIHDIVLAGGSSRIPKIQQLLEEFFSGHKLDKSANIEEIVASGAAIRAAQLRGCDEIVANLLLLEATSFSLGIETKDGEMTFLIRQNTPLPSNEHYNFTCPDDQPAVDIKIFEGEGADNILLGRLSLELQPLSDSSQKEHHIEVTFDMNRIGDLCVSLTDKSTGNSKTIAVTSDKSPEDIARMVEEVNKL